MSVFTNRLDAAAEEADEYIRAVLELLGDRDPLAVLEELPAKIAEAIKGLALETIRHPEAPGKWSILEVIQHLADSELVWAWRLRLVIAQNRPTLTGYDQDAWVERLRYNQGDPGDALEMLRVMRAANLRLLRSLSPEELQRVGLHSERGEESVEHMVRLYAGHDLVHRRQLERIRVGQA